MQVAFLSEGATELGLAQGARDDEPWPRSFALQLLAERILDAGGEIQVWEPPLRRGGGAGPILKRTRAYIKEAARAGASAVVVLVDADGRGVKRLRRLNEHRQRLIGERSALAIPTAIGVAVETIEAWLLADEQGLQRALALQGTPDAVDAPEQLKGKRGSGSHPKDVLRRLLEQDMLGPRSFLAQVRAIVLELDLGVLARRCRSFRRFRDEVRQNLGPLFQS